MAGCGQEEEDTAAPGTAQVEEEWGAAGESIRGVVDIDLGLPINSESKSDN